MYILQELQVIETSGVFDIKWRGSILGLLPCLGQASADGSLRLLFFARRFALSSTTFWEVHISHLSAVMLSNSLSVSHNFLFLLEMNLFRLLFVVLL